MHIKESIEKKFNKNNDKNKAKKETIPKYDIYTISWRK